MLNKFLLITLGGSGEKLARYLAQDLEQRLGREEWDRGVPNAWRWLCVDVAHASDVITNDVPAELGRTGTRLGLTRHRLAYPDYHHGLTRDPDRLAGLVGSLPAADSGLPSPYYGAGQRPQVGNAVGLMELKALATAIEDEMKALDAPGVVDELRDVSNLFDSGREAGTPQTTLMIASSLGGGSGAGLLQLVTEIVLGHAATAEFGGSLTTLLFTPDIFVDLTPRERAGIQANALYTVSTMQNGYQWTGERSEVLQRLLSGAGVSLPDDRRAAMTNFFVGGNKAVAFKHQDRAIKAVSKALGRLLVDEEMAIGLTAHLEGNRNGAPVSDEYLFTKRTEVNRPASSLGYASVSLGDSLLAEYASERLAKAQLDTFLRGHAPQRSPREGDEEAVKRIAGEKLDWFVDQVELSQEKVLAHLYSQTALEGAVEGRVAEVEDEIRSGSGREDGGHWLKTIENPLNSYGKKLEDDRREGYSEKIEEWRLGLHDRLRATTAASIARLGAPVTIALLKRVQDAVRDSASVLRMRSEEKFGLESQERDRLSREALLAVKKLIRNDDPVLKEVIQARGKAVRLKEEGVCHELAAGLLKTVHELILPSMVACVEEAVRKLAAAEEGHHRKLVEGWAGEEVPQRLHEADNQRLLEPVGRFPTLFEELIEATTGGAKTTTGGAKKKKFKNTLQTAVEELLTGAWTTRSGDANDDELIGVSREWSPDSTARAEFFLNVEAPVFYERAKAWARHRPGALSDRLRLPLAQWIEDPVRSEAFVQTLEEAMHFAEPLVRINDAVHQRVHDSHEEPPKLHVSTIPVRFDSTAGRRIAAALEKAGIASGQIPTLFDGASSAQAVEISSFLSQPVEPVVVGNLFRPIHDDWIERRNTAMRQQFSAFRRTRPLSLFVPISQDELKRFVRGWIVGRLSGQITDLEGSWNDCPMRVWSAGEWLQFPRHLLGGASPTDESDVLGHVLESLPLAMASFASERYEELQAYMRVLQLGDLDHLSTSLSHGPPGPDPESEIEVAGIYDEGPGTRRQALLAEVHRLRAEALEYVSKRPISEDSVSGLSPRWETAELFLEGLERVQDAIVEATVPPDMPPDGDPASLPR